MRRDVDLARRLVAVALCLAMASSGCGHSVLNPVLHDPDEPPSPGKRSPMLKVHLKSGELLVLDSWRLSDDRSRLEGTGTSFSARREEGARGRQSVPIEAVALLETDSPEHVRPFGTSALAVMTTVFGALAAVCASDPKGCFGSCPTFYFPGEDEGRPVAEGFSASIARALEARDVDALFAGRPDGERRLVLTMRNEALETQAVRRLRLWAAPRPPGGRVLADPAGRLHAALDLVPPAGCRAPEGDCLNATRAFDEKERVSGADPSDLATRETVELVFPAASGRVGLVVGARQTILSTFLFYQTMAFLGRGAGAFLARVESGEVDPARAMGMARVLGGIDAEAAEGDQPFRPIGTFDEAGPIAGDVQVLPFDASGAGALRVRLRLAKGHWRLGYLALARLGGRVAARVLSPVSVEKNGRRDDEALSALRAGDRHVVTLPGDVHRVAFALPGPARDLELFLESEGYYYEWMRGEWLSEEDPGMALLALTDPHEALRRLAGPFQAREPGLERAFWSSRFRK